jgi:hypothetical protein
VSVAHNHGKEKAMDIPPYKLRIKIGDAEFEAEGPQDVVQKAFEKFLGATERAPSIPAKKPYADEMKPPSHDATEGGPIDSGILQRMFDVDPKRQIVSLRVLPPVGPNRACDAGILILYGAQTQLRVAALPVTRFKAGLLKSGVQFNRVNNMMAPYSQIIIKGGTGVGGKYSLNNQGIVQAENLIRKIFG